MSSLSAARARMSVSHTLFTSPEGAVVVFALSTTHWRWQGHFDEAGKNNLKNPRPLAEAVGDTGLKTGQGIHTAEAPLPF